MTPKLYTLVVKIPHSVDPMAMLVPLYKRGVLEEIRGTDGDLIEWRSAFRDHLTQAWNALPVELPRAHR